MYGKPGKDMCSEDLAVAGYVEFGVHGPWMDMDTLEEIHKVLLNKYYRAVIPPDRRYAVFVPPDEADP